MRKTGLAVRACGATVVLGALPAGAAAIHVLHGADSKTVSVARDGINIVKGGGAPLRQPLAPVKTANRPASYAVAAGGVLWLVEPNAGRLTVCSLRGSSVAGQSRIHCGAARLR